MSMCRGRDVADLGYAVQACNIHSALGEFSELEYHVPAIGPGTGRMRSEDVSQTWAFRGTGRGDSAHRGTIADGDVVRRLI